MHDARLPKFTLDPHIRHVDTGGHDFTVWKTDLYHLAPFLFREK